MKKYMIIYSHLEISHSKESEEVIISTGVRNLLKNVYKCENHFLE